MKTRSLDPLASVGESNQYSKWPTAGEMQMHLAVGRTEGRWLSVARLADHHSAKLFTQTH